MLLGYLLELLRDDIEALGFSDRYGGLVQKVTYKDRDRDGKYIDQSFPVSCMVNQQDCNTSGQNYTDLIPNDKLKGVMYFEALQGMSDQGALVASGKVYKSMRIYQGRARLVGWVNTKRLGAEGCFLTAQLTRKLMELLNTKFVKIDDGSFLDGARVEFNVNQEVIKNDQIFNQYTYNLDQQFLLYPYDYFAIDVDIRATIKTGCPFDIVLANSAMWDGVVNTDVGAIDADYLGDDTGTFTGVQKLGALDCEISSSSGVSFVVKGIDRDDNEIVLGTFIGAIGDLLNTPANWVTSFSIYNYIAANPVGDTEIFSLAKLDFATDFSFLNIDSKNIFVEIRQGSSIGVPVVAESILYMYREDILGTYTTPTHLAISGTDMLITESGSNTGISQNFTDRLYTTRSVTDTYSLMQVYRIKIDDPTGDIYYYSSVVLYRQSFTGRDADGFPTYAAPETVNSMANITQFIGLCLLDERVNGRPVLMVTTTGANAFIILEWDGATWTSTLLPATGAFAGLASPLSADGEALGNVVYFQTRRNASGEVTRLTYTGDYKVGGNWSSVTLADNTTGQTSEGTGATASIRNANSIIADWNNLVFGQPTIYITSNIYHTIQKIVANKSGASINADYDVTIVAGISNVGGNVGGALGVNTLMQPMGLAIDPNRPNVIIFCERTGSYVVRELDTTSTIVTTIKGKYGVIGKTEAIEF